MRINGVALRELRQALGWRGVRLAVAAEISPQYLSNIEAGRRHGSPEVWTRLADVLGVPVAAITDSQDLGETSRRTPTP